MGKRSDFERVPRDFYPTPLAAVLPLAPHLPDGDFYYWEPCAGDGALDNHIVSIAAGLGHTWLPFESSDIEPRNEFVHQADALEVSLPNAEISHIITNPPWDRKVLHPMIERFSASRPTWLLFDADWMHTKQSAPFMPYLRKVVSVGRVKWIPDSKMTGKDNCAWHLFDQTGVYTGETVFHGRTAQ